MASVGDIVKSAGKKFASEALNKVGSGLNVSGILDGRLSISGTLNNLLQKDVVSSEANGPLKDLLATTNPGAIQYPPDLDKRNYIMFHIMERTRPTESGQVNNPFTQLKKIPSYGTIILPVPANLRNDLGAMYNDEPLGVAGGFGTGEVTIGGAGDEVKQLMGSTWDRAESILAKAGADIVNSPSAALTLGGAALALKQSGAVGGIGAAVLTTQIAKGIFYSDGVAMNPRMAVMFNGMQFRTFSFGYRFIARNKTESDTILKLCRKFQYHMLPSYYKTSVEGRISTTKSGFIYPEEFYIQFSESLEPYMFKFRPCVLKNVNVQYNSDGPDFFAETNAPITVDLTLEFQEVQIQTKETMEQDYSGTLSVG